MPTLFALAFWLKILYIISSFRLFIEDLLDTVHNYKSSPPACLQTNYNRYCTAYPILTAKFTLVPLKLNHLNVDHSNVDVINIFTALSPTQVLPIYMVSLIMTWVKVFRIIPEFRILRLTFHRLSIESQPQNPELSRF